MPGNRLGDFHIRHIFETGILDTCHFAVLKEEDIKVCDIVDMYVGPCLIATENSNLATLQVPHCQHFHRYVKTHSRRWPVNSGGTNDLNLFSIGIGKKDAGSANPGFILFRDRLET